MPVLRGYTLLKGFNDLATTHPQIAEEWSEKNFPLTPETSKSQIKIKCLVEVQDLRV